MYYVIVHGATRANYELIQWDNLNFIEGMYNKESKTLEILVYFSEQLRQSAVRTLLRTQFGKYLTSHITTSGSDWQQWLEHSRKRLHTKPAEESSGFKALAPIGNPPPPPSIDLEYIDCSKRGSKGKQLPTVATEAPGESFDPPTELPAEEVGDCPMEAPFSALTAPTAPRLTAEEPAEDDGDCPMETLSPPPSLSTAPKRGAPKPSPEPPAKAPRVASGPQLTTGLSAEAKLLERLRELELTNAQLVTSNAQLVTSNAQLVTTNAQLATANAQLTTSITKLVDTNAALATNNAELVRNNTRVTVANEELMAKHTSQSCIIAKLNNEKNALIAVLMQRTTAAPPPEPQQSAPGVFVFNLQFLRKEMEMKGFVQQLADVCRHIKQMYVDRTGQQPVYQWEPANNQGWAYPVDVMDTIKAWTREFFAR